MTNWTRLSRKLCVYAVAVSIGGLAMGVRTFAADKAGGDSDISTIMKKAFKGPAAKKPAAGAPAPAAPAGKKPPSLVQKAVEGTASEDEIKSLLGYTQELAKAKPPKGEQKDWDERTKSLTEAVEAISKGDKTAGAKLKTASNCKACHELHQDK